MNDSRPKHRLARVFAVKTALQPIEHLREFAYESDPETRPEVLSELERRAIWRDHHPRQGKSLSQIALALGVRV